MGDLSRGLNIKFPTLSLQSSSCSGHGGKLNIYEITRVFLPCIINRSTAPYPIIRKIRTPISIIHLTKYL